MIVHYTCDIVHSPNSMGISNSHSGSLDVHVCTQTEYYNRVGGRGTHVYLYVMYMYMMYTCCCWPVVPMMRTRSKERSAAAQWVSTSGQYDAHRGQERMDTTHAMDRMETAHPPGEPLPLPLPLLPVLSFSNFLSVCSACKCMCVCIICLCMFNGNGESIMLGKSRVYVNFQ